MGSYGLVRIVYTNKSVSADTVWCGICMYMLGIGKHLKETRQSQLFCGYKLSIIAILHTYMHL